MAVRVPMSFCWARPVSRVVAVLSVAISTGILIGTSIDLAIAKRPLPKPTGYVNDLADVIPSTAQSRLERLLEQVDAKLQVQVAIATIPDLEGEDPAEYANQLYEAWGIGGKGTHRGLLIMNAISDRQIRVEVGYGLEGVLPDGRVGAILDRDALPWLKQERYDQAYAATVRGLLQPILTEAGQDPAAIDSLLMSGGYQRVRHRQRGDQIPIRLVIAIVVLMIVLSSNNRRGRGGQFLSYGGYGGFGGFGGFGGGGGGFGGFGGGMSGGGGAGRGY